MRRLSLILAGILGGLVLAAMAIRPLYFLFLKEYPDCAPNQQDGQCGLASFMDLLYAVGVAGILWVLSAILLSLYLVRRFAPRPARSRARSENNPAQSNNPTVFFHTAHT
jgi:hypothetical protein